MTFKKITFNDVKIFLIYLAVSLYGLLIFLKQHLNINLGYYELLIVAFIGWLIKISIGIIPKELQEGLGNLLTPTSKQKFIEFINMKDDIKSIASSIQLNKIEDNTRLSRDIINEPFGDLTPVNSSRTNNDFEINISYSNENKI
jgi:hypothetical protein